MKSMTGFAKVQFEIENTLYSVEIKTLNSKQLDINTKIPILYKEKDLEIRSMLGRLNRGKIDFTLTEENDKAVPTSRMNIDVAAMHYADCQQLQSVLGVQQNPSETLSAVLALSDVWACPDIKELDSEVLDVIFQNIDKAISAVDDFRLEEGEILKKDFIYRIGLIEEKLSKVPLYEEERITQVKERMYKYFSELEVKVDENRFTQELIYYLEKLDITEEKVRLKKHLDYFNEVIDEGECVGKKLGFVVQEIGREINTMGSKANNADIQRLVVEMKDELEKIKEQLGNIL
ncbi:MAG: YicC family protein [Bacteroidales bacterium]|jgi:uncharacterized protein (TIGR00255 family)|nr:YicC family protein [Bacteroidales bacterium]